MNTKQWVKAGALMGALVGCVAGGAWAADPNAANDMDALTIRITPNLDYGVNVETATTQLTGEAAGDLDVAMDLNATYYFVSPASVTIVGNFNNQEVKLKAEGKTAGGWTVDTDNVIEGNAVQVYALFAVNKTSRPVDGEFEADAGRHQVMLSGLEQFAGEPNGAAEDNDRTDNRFEIANGAMTGGTSMDNLALNTLTQLWLRLDTPSTSTVDGPQEIQVIVTAASGTTN